MKKIKILFSAFLLSILLFSGDLHAQRFETRFKNTRYERSHDYYAANNKPNRYSGWNSNYYQKNERKNSGIFGVKTRHQKQYNKRYYKSNNGKHKGWYKHKVYRKKNR